MTEPHDERDQRLADLLSDSVSDVEPANRLDDIRSRTRNGTKVTSMSSRRPWLYAVGGAVVATAAVITAIAAAGGTLPGMTADDEPSPGHQPSHHATNQPKPSEDASSPDPAESEAADPAAVVGVYFAGDTPQGQRLYREFQRSSDGTDPVVFAVDASVTGAAHDADYHSLWPSGVSVTSAADDGNGLITVELTGAPADRPAGMSAGDAGLALQQVVYSAQAAVGQGRLPVQIESGDGPVDRMLGEQVSEPLDAASPLKTLSLVSLSSPSEGEHLSGDTLKVDGVANSFEANVVVRLQRWEGTEIVDQEPFTASGYMGNKLFPFSGTIDISQVPPGDYVLMAMTDDPSDGEGYGSFSDTRRITIE